MRAPIGYDRQVGSITFFSDVPEGAMVQITDASREDILSASAISLRQALESYPGHSPAVAFFVSCATRRRILGTQAKEEYETLKPQLPSNLTCCGFYAYGEISPLELTGQTQFHNKTFVTLLLGEA